MPPQQNCHRNFQDEKDFKNTSLNHDIVITQEQLVLISDVSPAVTLIKTFLESYRNFYCQLPLEQRENYPPNMALGSLFDLVVSAKYAERLVSDGGWTYCAGDNLSDGSSLYFCYLRTCPRCSVHKSIKPKVASNKPGSGVGEVKQ